MPQPTINYRARASIESRAHAQHEAALMRWESVEVLNVWLSQRCESAWRELRHPEWPELSIADA
ncbi:hypothetical protein M4D49_29535, partial [Cupriavidus pauculus]|uniref:hypothetical protein n=1 Tax=Cupriavidus pauculus TaxID=82633 RepID=UPI0020408F6B